MDALISILFFVAIVLFQVIAVTAKRARKRPRETDAETGARPSSGAGGVLGRVFSQIQEELERAARQARARQEGPTGWEQLMSGPPAPEAPVSSVAKTRAVREVRRPDAAPPAPVKKRPAPVQPAEEGPQKLKVPVFAAREPAPGKPATPLPAFAGSPVSVADLRRAFVWSEILGPPLALRKTPEDRWSPEIM